MSGVGFRELRSALVDIRKAIGLDCLTSVAWDGQILRVIAAMPSSGLAPYVMTFDSEDDFAIKSEVLLKQFSEGIAAYFGKSDVA